MDLPSLPGPATPPASVPTAPAPRHDGWTPQRQRTFLESVAQGHSIEAACRIVGLSHQSAYAFRNRASGAAFALGWQAAQLIGRHRLADALLVRAIEGQTETFTRANGDVVERHRFDNRLATAMLTRLDRFAEANANESTHHAARMVAGEFDAFLDTLDSERPARAALFLHTRAVINGDDTRAADLAPVLALARADRHARTGAATVSDIDVSDLDLADRAQWSGEQWMRAEEAGLLAIAPLAPPGDTDGNPQLPQQDNDEDEENEDPVWWDEIEEEWFTRFPPPRGFRGEENGEYGEEDYRRTLTGDEETVMVAARRLDLDDLLAAEAPERDTWFAVIAARNARRYGLDDAQDQDDPPAPSPATDAAATAPRCAPGCLAPPPAAPPAHAARVTLDFAARRA